MKKLSIILLLIITSIGSFLISCECRGIGDMCKNSDSAYIRFIAEQREYGDIDTLRSNNLCIQAGVTTVGNAMSPNISFGHVYASCLGCFDYMTSYSLQSNKNIITIFNDTIIAGTNLLQKAELSPYFDLNFVMLDLDSTFILNSGANVFTFTASFDDKTLSITDTLFVDSSFGF